MVISYFLCIHWLSKISQVNGCAAQVNYVPTFCWIVMVNKEINKSHFNIYYLKLLFVFVMKNIRVLSLWVATQLAQNTALPVIKKEPHLLTCCLAHFLIPLKVKFLTASNTASCIQNDHSLLSWMNVGLNI